MPVEQRRQIVLMEYGCDEIASARAMQLLSNISIDKEIKEKAGEDAEYFLYIHEMLMRFRRGGRRPRKQRQIIGC